MPLKSDIIIDAGKFDPANISEQAKQLNAGLIAKLSNGGKEWHEVGAAKYRKMRWAGETALPAPVPLPQGIDFTIPSREPGREIPCRIMYPTSRTTEDERRRCRGTVMHFHGGGWTLGDEKSHDSLLQFYADAGDLAVISVGYRLAPEDPFPKGPEDCMDAGEYIAKVSEERYGGPLRFIGGESAGGHLSLITTFHLLKVIPDFKLSGLLLHFGSYDLSGLPQYYHLTTNVPILPQSTSSRFFEAFMPNMTEDQKKSPSVSPFYEDLSKFRERLPSALFTCGTVDPLLDDSVMMGTKWLMAGGEAIVKIYTGGPHGFIGFPPAVLKESGEALMDTKTYIEDCMAKA
ncbi:AB hydrolase superfamily protein B1A11.02 [Lachnellula suecica]|uniref:AB hydrolase superfamily protein B1A11.02 n=1 Tax=Lachnellula suecica TaxID=602035 RepID=A0A8T9C0P6_9HELO|nr:AB hydrolase superfamily protein B1A11.02 [Lachnellula suecica]